MGTILSIGPEPLSSLKSWQTSWLTFRQPSCKIERELLIKSDTSSGVWTLFTDGASNAKGSGLGIVLKSPTGNIVRQSIRTTKLTNNEAEIKAMIVGLELARSLGAKIIEVKCDSLLMVNQVNGTFEV